MTNHAREERRREMVRAESSTIRDRVKSCGVSRRAEDARRQERRESVWLSAVATGLPASVVYKTARSPRPFLGAARNSPRDAKSPR